MQHGKLSYCMSSSDYKLKDKHKENKRDVQMFKYRPEAERLLDNMLNNVNPRILQLSILKPMSENSGHAACKLSLNSCTGVRIPFSTHSVPTISRT